MQLFEESRYVDGLIFAILWATVIFFNWRDREDTSQSEEKAP